MGYKVPLVIYSADGNRTVVGTAEVYDNNGEFYIAGELDVKYSHILEPLDYNAEFSFSPIPGEAAVVPNDDGDTIIRGEN